MINWLRYIILLLIFIISCKLGMLKANKYDERLQELKKIKSSIEMLRTKIEFTYEPIKEIFTEISKLIYLDKKNIFYSAVENMRNSDVFTSWNKAIDDNMILNKEDKVCIKSFGKLLGKTDKFGQINEINLLSINLDKLIDNAENEKRKNFRLFKTLGPTIGIAMCILLI